MCGNGSRLTKHRNALRARARRQFHYWRQQVIQLSSGREEAHWTEEEADSDESDPPMNVLDVVIDIVSDLTSPECLQFERGWVNMEEVFNKAERQHLSRQDVDEALDNWAGMGIVHRHHDGTKVKMLVPSGDPGHEELKDQEDPFMCEDLPSAMRTSLQDIFDQAMQGGHGVICDTNTVVPHPHDG